MNLSHILGMTFVIVLAGCASAPAPKPAMADQQYQVLAANKVGIIKCASSGRMDIPIATAGVTFVDSTINSMSYDWDRLQQAMDHMEAQTPSDMYCTQSAITIGQLQQRIARNNAAVAADQQAWRDLTNNRPKQTYCNKVGTQTLCSTY